MFVFIFINFYLAIIYYQTDNFGSHANHSCQTASILTIEEWLQSIQEGQLVGTLMIAFTKAFDSIDHNILIQKLQLCKCNQRAIQCIKLYIEEHQQKLCMSSTQ